MVENTGIYNFKCFQDKYGSLVPIEAEESVPFEIKRVYYIYDVEQGMRRGFHSHLELQQALICVHGSVKILVKTPYESQDIILDNPTQALYIGPMVWREMYDFSSDAVLLVLANNHFELSDYVRDYSQYEMLAKSYFVEKDI